MVEDGLINEREALLRVDPLQLNAFLQSMLDPAGRRYRDGDGVLCVVCYVLCDVITSARRCSAWIRCS